MKIGVTFSKLLFKDRLSSPLLSVLKQQLIVVQGNWSRARNRKFSILIVVLVSALIYCVTCNLSGQLFSHP